jgi:hypothetical protein
MATPLRVLPVPPNLSLKRKSKWMRPFASA